jgi:hypothetical protein
MTRQQASLASTIRSSEKFEFLPTKLRTVFFIPVVVGLDVLAMLVARAREVIEYLTELSQNLYARRHVAVLVSYGGQI